MKILSVAAIVVLLFVFSFFTERPVPRKELPEPTASTPEVIGYDDGTCGGHSLPPSFPSEELMLEYISLMRSELMMVYGEIHPESELTITHYYRLKNPPPETEVNQVTLYQSGMTLEYDTARERIMIRYNNYYSFDIETRGLWTERPFPNEAYIREIDGVTYYIRKVDASIAETVMFLWSVEWYNADGYYMSASFPYRFTADEVLAYVSDLERVEIVG